MKKTIFLVAAIVLFLFASAQAAVVWSEPNGSTAYFDWANGQSLNGLFGDPVPVDSSTFVFFPSMFRAESFDRQTDSISDILEFELIAHSGYSFQSISIVEYGDYGILGNGLVKVSGTLSVENLDTEDTVNNDLINDLPERFPADAFGLWQAWAGIDIAEADWTHLRIKLENNLFVVSGSDSASWIEKKVLGNAIAVRIIPEPATIATLGIGTTLTLLKSRKKPYKA